MLVTCLVMPNMLRRQLVEELLLGDICKDLSVVVPLVRRDEPFRGFGVKLNAQDNDLLLQNEGFVRVVKRCEWQIDLAASSMYAVMMHSFVT